MEARLELSDFRTWQKQELGAELYSRGLRARNDHVDQS